MPLHLLWTLLQAFSMPVSRYTHQHQRVPVKITKTIMNNKQNVIANCMHRKISFNKSGWPSGPFIQRWSRESEEFWSSKNPNQNSWAESLRDSNANLLSACSMSLYIKTKQWQYCMRKTHLLTWARTVCLSCNAKKRPTSNNWAVVAIFQSVRKQKVTPLNGVTLVPRLCFATCCLYLFWKQSLPASSCCHDWAGNRIRGEEDKRAMRLRAGLGSVLIFYSNVVKNSVVFYDWSCVSPVASTPVLTTPQSVTWSLANRKNKLSRGNNMTEASSSI